MTPEATSPQLASQKLTAAGRAARAQGTYEHRVLKVIICLVGQGGHAIA
jgi:hypothetical protein